MRHIARQSAHCLHTFQILPHFVRGAAVSGIPVLAGNHRHLHNGKIFVEPVKGGTCSAPAAVYHTGSRLVPEIPGSRKAYPVKYGTKGTRRSGIIDRRTDNHAIGCLHFLNKVVIKLVFENTSAGTFFAALHTGGATLYRLVADPENFAFNILFLQCLSNFAQCGKSTPILVRTAINQQHFHKLHLFINSSCYGQ